MSKIYTSADQLIGKTPLLELVHIEKEEGLEARVLAKLEYFNPAAAESENSQPSKPQFSAYCTLTMPGFVNSPVVKLSANQRIGIFACRS